MIEDRMLAPDAADRFLLQNGRGIKIAGNLPPMVPSQVFGTYVIHRS